jgi:hypothetical protein
MTLIATIFMSHFVLRPPLWSNGQGSWQQIQRCRFDSRRCQIFYEIVGLEWDPLSLVSTIEKLLERKSSGSWSRKSELHPWGSAPLTTRHPSIR